MGLIDFSLGDIGSLFTNVREAITGKGIEDPTKKAEIELKLQQLEQAANMGQIQINANEANNSNWFVSGARPFILWVCGISVAYTFILAPFLHSFFYVFKVNFPLPQLNMGLLFNLMVSMLGLSGFRTYEKLKGVNGRHQ